MEVTTLACCGTTGIADDTLQSMQQGGEMNVPATPAIPDALRVGILYDDDAHVERGAAGQVWAPGQAAGLFGRHVANSEFLNSYLDFGTWDEVVGIVSSDKSRASLVERFNSNVRAQSERKRMRIVMRRNFHASFLPMSPVHVVHMPQPMDVEYAWVRHAMGSHPFALSGVTHTISSKAIMERFLQFVTAPFEEYDTLFCISEASRRVVQAVTENYRSYLKERGGTAPQRRVLLECVPLGVDLAKFRPAEPTIRALVRSELEIAEDAVCVLFVGRLSYHAKVHPFPAFRAVAEAAKRCGTKVHFVLGGWAEDAATITHFLDGARVICPDVPVTIVDAMKPENRFRVWSVGDVFTSLTDNIQETLSQTVLEAQACELPVVVTNWDGCRDEVEDGESGFLVPTYALPGASTDATSKYLLGETSYAEFLGQANQTIAVDLASAIEAFEALFSSPHLRKRMGAAGRERMARRFAWPGIIRQYEQVWHEQELRRISVAASTRRGEAATPVLFPHLDFSFSSYPTEALATNRLVVRTPDADERMTSLLRLRLTSYQNSDRVGNPGILRYLLSLAASPVPLGQLEEALMMERALPQMRLATLAWMLKYDLLRLCK